MASYSGTALGRAVEVSVDERGHVVSVRIEEKLIGRLWPEQLGRGVVFAHAEARAAARTDG